jgi:predicted ribonuclease YlaK
MTKHANNTRNTRKVKQIRGEERESSSKFNSFALDWFSPVGNQQAIIDSIDVNDLTIVDSPSGTGKSTTVLWKALTEYKNRHFKKVYLIKTPTEVGTDQIGFLPSSAEDKISVHMESMKSIFYQFISKEKLENDIKSGNIILTIPNFLLGVTLDDSFIIIEESQTLNPDTVKLIAERCGQNSVVVVVGDSRQRYSVKKREDGFKDLIDKVTILNEDGSRTPKYDTVGYIKMTSDNNMRSALSKLITEIYDI